MNKRCYICILTNMQRPMPRQTSDRYHEFLARLLKQPRDMEDLTDYFTVDRRTIYRWIKTIKEQLHIDIKTIKGKLYLSEESKDRIQNNSLNKWMFNTFSLMNLLDGREALMDRILLEHIPSSSNLEPILEAMENNQWISFDYIKYYNNPDLKPQRYRRMEPYCVKLFERRWYVFCHSGEKKGNNGMRTFSLDQISNLKVMKTTFKLPKDFRAEAYFKDVYGITTGDNGPLQTIEVKVANARANYFRALPLHHSQQEIERNAEYSIFTYELRPSNDFYQILLHNAEHVEVLSPETVREEIAKKVSAMAEKYKEYYERFSNNILSGKRFKSVSS